MSLEEPFVNVFNSENGGTAHPGQGRDFYKLWIEEASAPYTSHEKVGYEMLKKFYPEHSIVMTDNVSLTSSFMAYPDLLLKPLESSPLLTEVAFIPGKRSGNKGSLADQVKFGAFAVAWNKYDFLLYIVTWPLTYGFAVQYYILHEGPEEPARELLLNAGVWANELHQEVWVYDGGFWQKSHDLWIEIQKGNWDDVILKPEFKKVLKKDIYGFFKSEAVYKTLGIPWKRGLIMYGPPGNGKTISLKTVMKECSAKGFQPLYVKTFAHWAGEEAAMQLIFGKARQLAPCVIDLDALINDRNRSYFLNQVDGLADNDGLLLIGTTNHFDRLDPGLSSRPSRFDRKYLFDDPDKEERRLYCQYWQDKLASNPDISYSDSLAWEVANLTEHFSFAYLKEAHVSSLVTLAGAEEGEHLVFAHVIKAQIKELAKQLGNNSYIPHHNPQPSQSLSPGTHHSRRDIRALLDSLTTGSNNAPMWTDPSSGRVYQQAPSAGVNGEVNEKDFRRLLDDLSRRIDSQGHDVKDILDAVLYRQTHHAPSYQASGSGYSSTSPVNINAHSPSRMTSRAMLYPDEQNEFKELLNRLSSLAPSSMNSFE